MARFNTLQELYDSSSQDVRDLNRVLFEGLTQSKEPKEGKTNKFRNTKVTVDGITFDSIKECNRWFELRQLEQSGAILYLQRQVWFELQPAHEYHGKHIRALRMRLDATYEENGRKIAEDTKGMVTAEWNSKAKIFREKFPEYELRIV